MAQRYRDATRARRGKLSQMMGQLNFAVAARAADLLPITMVACGDLVSEDLVVHVQQPVDMRARLPIAFKIATFFEARQREPDDSFRFARLWADLHATWMVANKTSLNDMAAAIREMISLLRISPPSDQEVVSVFQSVWINAVEDAAKGDVSWEEAQTVMPPVEPEPVAVPLQKFRFFESSAHAFDQAKLFLLTPALAESLQFLRVIDDEAVRGLVAHHWQARPDFQAQWATLTDSEILAIYEMLYYADISGWDAFLVASCAGVIFSLCKSNDMTAGFLRSRTQNLMKDYPDLQLADKLEMNHLTKFIELYVPNSIDMTFVSRYLQTAYAHLDEGRAKSIAWVIEQARGHKYTHVIAFATSTVKYDYLTLLYLRNCPETAWVNYIKAGFCLCRDPWGSLTAPKITARMCPDMSNLGITIQKKTQKTYKHYAGGFVPGGTYTEAQIKAIAESIITFTTEKNEQEFDIGKILVDLYPGLEYTEIDGSYFFYDSSDHKIRIDPGNAIPPSNLITDDSDDENGEGGDPDDDAANVVDGNRGGAPRVY